MVYPHLSKAPIVEGLIDIQVKPRTDVSVENLGSLVEKLKPSYPTVKDIRYYRAELKYDANQPASSSIDAKHVGYRFERQSPPFVILARGDAFTVSRLRPYDTWDDLIAEARLHWGLYREVCKPETVTRIATRFINRIELPIDALDFDDYLAAPANIPSGFPQTINHFLTRIVIPDKDSGSSVAIGQALETPNAETKTVPVILDIDVFKEVDLSIDSEEIWTLLTKMRDLKNRAFFSSLTPKALELFR